MKVERGKLLEFTANVMKKMGCNDGSAKAVAEVLVEADMRGISSHGVARLKRYINHINEGIIDPRGEPTVVFETPLSLVVDGNNGVGQYVAKVSMGKVIEKARTCGIGMASVRNSNHYGIAGYYAEMAVKNGLVGISLTNTAPMVVPTFSKRALLGTNPIAFAFPICGGYPILIDMSTSVVARGKLEVYSRLRKEIPKGWAVDETGHTTSNPERVLTNLRERRGGGLLPLGGESEAFGGHKGYGLALLVELLCSGLSLGAFSYDTYTGKGKVTHFFAAFDLSLFGDPEQIKAYVIELTNVLESAEKAIGEDRIYIHGEKEYERREESLRNGVVEIDVPTYQELEKIAEDLRVPW